MGGGPQYALTPAALSDSAALEDQGGYSISSPFARLVLQTESTAIRLSTHGDFRSLDATLAKVGVWVNGAYLRSFTPTANGNEDFVIYPGSGLNTVELVAGATTRPNGVGSVRGTWLVSATADKPMTQLLDVANDRLLIYGDSIAVGDGAGAEVQRDAWAMRVRAAYAGDVSLEAWGWRSLYEDCSTNGLRAAFVAKVAARSPTAIWLAIGTNDYGLNRWSASSFGAAYAALLDDLHAALPGAIIYAQTPLVRSSEVANGSGSTLGEYRTQIATACGTRPWATLIDGSAYLTTGDLADGVHPSVTGHGKLATAVLTELA